MTRVLFCAIREKGHLHPCVGPAERLCEAGAEVGFYVEHSSHKAATRGASFAENVRDASWLHGFIRGLLLDGVEAQIEPLRLAIRQFEPDVVAIDPMLYAAVIAAELERVPWAAISNSLNPVLPESIDSALLRSVRALASERDALFARHRLRAEFRGCDLLSPDLTVAFTTEEFVGRSVPGVHTVGPSLPRGVRGDERPFPWHRVDGRFPLVYMSFGSQIYHQPVLFRRVVEALAVLPVQLVLSVGELFGSDELGPLPANVIAAEYVPQLEMLRRARVLITHGGANSVMEALACGVPMLVSPLCNDQFHQARFVETAGLGRALDLAHATTSEIAAAVSDLLAVEMRARATEMAVSYARDGAAETARLIIELAARSRPAPRS